MKREFLPFGPFVFSQSTIRTKHFLILILLSFQMIAITLSQDYTALLNILVAVLAVFSSDLIYMKLSKESIKFDMVTLTTGIIIGFCFPNTYSYIYVGLIVFISFFVSKLLFGGTGSNWANPVVITICIAYVSSESLFPSNLNSFELIQGNGSMFSVLQTSGLQKIQNDQHITSMFNILFQNIGVIIPDGYITLLTKYTSSIPAFRYNLLTILASIILVSFNVIDKIIPTVFLSSYGLLVWLFSMMPINGTIATGDILVAWCTSGVLFYTFFVLTEAASTPNTILGKCIFAIFTAIFTFLICGPGGSAIGIAFSILIGNIFTPLIIGAENKLIRRRLRRNYGR